MRLKKFSAKNVHGFLDFDIEFYDEITFLIGINGSGKTSVLKLILGLTTPSYYDLSNISYDYCEVVAIDDKNNEVVISARKEDESHFRLYLTINGLEETTSSIKRNIGYESDIGDDNNEFDSDKWKSVFFFESVVKKIKSINSPKFLGLERRLLDEFGLAGNNEHLFRLGKRQSDRHNRRRNLSTIDSGLFDVQFLIYEYIRNVAEQQPIISSEFKDKIFKQSFNYISDQNLYTPQFSNVNLTERKENVIDAVKKLDLDYLVDDVSNYFSKMIELKKKVDDVVLKSFKGKGKRTDNALKEETDVFSQWLNNIPQLKKIDEIIQFSKEYQVQLEELRTPIKKLEKITTKFLTEGNKSLSISPNGEILVSYKNGNKADLFKLSSGEKQVIIMVAHLIFAEDLKNTGVYIIDEPELSLHISWQEIFVDAILEASPNTQFLLATHSPSIIAKLEREKFCQDISESYNAKI